MKTIPKSVQVRFSFAFLMMICIFSFTSVHSQVLFTQGVDADFHRGQYNDMLVASNNVFLPFQATSVNSWLTTTVLPQTLTRHKAASWNNRFVYVTGGYNGVSYSSAVYRATLQASGISTWTTLGSLPVALSSHAVVAGNNTIYVIGGRDDSNIYNTIYHATINTDGSIGSWQTSSVSLPTNLWGHTAVYCNGYIYVAGGSDNTTATSATNKVYRAKVNADNTLSAFSTLTDLPSTLNGHAMVTNGTDIFILGGFQDGGTKVNTVYKSTSGNDGSLSAWTAQTALPTAVSNHSAVVINGIIAVMAGETGTGLTKDIHFGNVNAGTLSWTAGSEMTDNTKDGTAYASNGQIVYSGGENLSATPIHNSRYTPLTLSANRKSNGMFISTPFTQLGDERHITELIFSRTIAAGSNLQVSYRMAGNDKIWGDWSALNSVSPIAINDTARYLQYKVVFTSNGTDNATLHSVTLSTPGTQLSGSLNAIPTFTKAASPYWVTGNISFTAGTHTFEAGTRFLFMPGITMEVGAANIICNGIAGDSVYFTGYTDEQGLWGGIYYNASSSSGVSSQFNHVVISNAGAGTYAANLYCLNTSEPTLNNCNIHGSTANGIRLNNAHIMIDNSRIHHNTLNGLSLTNASPTINNTLIDYNILAGVWYNSTTSNPNYFASEIANNQYGIRYDSPNFSFYEPNGSPLLTNNTYNGVAINGGNIISTNKVWTTITYDYILLGNITIMNNPAIRLTIEPGNTIKTVNGATIQVATTSNGGELYAIGTPVNPIIFTSWDGSIGGWNGIFFHTNSDIYGSTPSVLDYCIIEKGNNYNIYADGTNVRILNSTIQNSAQDGIQFNNSTGLMENCIIQNSAQYGLWLSGTSPGSSPDVKDCQFLNNNNYPVYIATTQCIYLPDNNTYTGNTPNYIAHAGGNLTTTQTFYFDGIAYHILNNLQIGHDPLIALTIEPGVTLEFNPGTRLQIGYYSSYSRYGSLFAEGTDVLPITFKAYNDTPGGWEGIYFETRSNLGGASSTMKYCIVEQGNNYNIYSENTTEPVMDSCTIRNSANDGLRLFTSTIQFSNCSFDNNGAYPVQLMNWQSVIIPNNNTYTGNTLQYIALPGGNYTSNYSIRHDGISYHILNNMQIGHDPLITLTIEPGNTLEFNPGTRLQIGYYLSYSRYGSLFAQGTDTLPITFKAYNDNPGGWEGIYLDTRSNLGGASSTMKYCIIEQGNDYNVYSENTTEPKMENCSIINSANIGLKTFNATLAHIRNTTITDNAGIGIYIDGTSALTIGNNPLYTNNIFGNAGQFEVYNNSANHTQARYNYWGTSDSAMIATRIFDKFDNSAKGIVYFMDFAALPSLPSTNTLMEGSVVYANSILSPMKSALMEIENFASVPVASTNTNINGEYVFASFPSGNYQMNITPFDAWGGVNATDALLILNHFAQIDTLTGMKLAAADVNMSSTVNGTDAMYVMQRFASLITDFPAGDYLYHTESLVVNNDHITNDIKMLCFGDVNASYEPTGAKSSSVDLVYEGTISVSPFSEFIVPVVLKTGMSTGAVSAGFYFPENHLEVLDVQMANGSTNFFWSAQNGLFKLAWCDMTPMNIASDQILLSIRFKAKSFTGMTSSILLDLFEDCELADQYALAQQGVVLAVPEIHSAITLVNSQTHNDFSFDVYPNPMADFAIIEFSLEKQSSVTIELFNLHGAHIKTISSSVFAAGKHQLELRIPGLDQGMYTLRMVSGNGTTAYSKVLKLVVTE
jgi:hypothetical protein